MQLSTDKMQARRDGAIGWMIFNNPARRNAISLEMWEAIGQILGDYAADDSVRVVVMRGAGGKSFAAGADISQFAEQRNNAEAAERYSQISAGGRKALVGLGKPLIALIEGFCMGGGLGIAMHADMRMASDDSEFGIPAAKLGLGYHYSTLKPLVDLVGPSAAKLILFSGRRFKAEEALRMGLINQILPRAELEPAVVDLAGEIATNAPLTVEAVKATVGEIVKDRSDRDMGRIDRMIAACFDSRDYAEGRTAFMEKRKPVFTGR
ncbi:MAG: enoyl-CoA hydratase [Alphaproteobacteria bacterium]|nr:enoyl-CoA hydratase [Alphaproteobacteria bacterium]